MGFWRVFGLFLLLQQACLGGVLLQTREDAVERSIYMGQLEKSAEQKPMASWGKCVKLHETLGGKVDGCQEFEPMEGNLEKCEVSECARGFHEKLLTGTAAEQPEGVRASVPEAAFSNPIVSSVESLEKAVLPQPDVSCELLEQPAKKPKKAEPEDSKAADGATSEEKPDSCPSVTRNSMAALLRDYPAEKYGSFELRLNDKCGLWEVWCEPCKSWNKVNKDNKIVSKSHQGG